MCCSNVRAHYCGQCHRVVIRNFIFSFYPRVGCVIRYTQPCNQLIVWRWRGLSISLSYNFLIYEIKVTIPEPQQRPVFSANLLFSVAQRNTAKTSQKGVPGVARWVKDPILALLEDAYLIPGLAQGYCKLGHSALDLVLPCCGISLQLQRWFGLWPGNFNTICSRCIYLKKKKKDQQRCCSQGACVSLE